MEIFFGEVKMTGEQLKDDVKTQKVLQNHRNFRFLGKVGPKSILTKFSKKIKIAEKGRDSRTGSSQIQTGHGREMSVMSIRTNLYAQFFISLVI